jgi:hypothetical protein
VKRLRPAQPLERTADFSGRRISIFVANFH